MLLDEFVELSRFFSKTDDVIYMGEDSLLPLACEFFKNVTHVDVKKSTIKANNLKWVECNIFQQKPQNISQEKFDAMINNLKVDVMKSFQSLEKMKSFLKEGGKLLMRLEASGRSNKELKYVSRAFLRDFSLKPILFFKLDDIDFVLASNEKS